MSTHNIQFHNEIRKLPLMFVFLIYRKNFIGTQNRVQFELAMVNEPSVLLRFDCSLTQRNWLKKVGVGWGGGGGGGGWIHSHISLNRRWRMTAKVSIIYPLARLCSFAKKIFVVLY